MTVRRRTRRAAAAFVWASMLPLGTSVAGPIGEPRAADAEGLSEDDRAMLRGWYAGYVRDRAESSARLEAGKPVPADVWSRHRAFPVAVTYALREQPKGTMLVLIDDQAVRVHAATMTVVDTARLS